MDVDKMNALFKSDVISKLGTKNEAGFGMGLYIVSELLHKYNCQVKVESIENKGSTFVIIFPQ
jgi:signal transduction histidine kinase